MTALHRVKAYFGMVPADELDAYDGYEDYDAYDEPRRSRHAQHPHHDSGRWDHRHDSRYGRDAARYDDSRYDESRYDGRYDSDRPDDRPDDRHDGHGRYESRHDSRYEAPRRSERWSSGSDGPAASLDDPDARPPRPRDSRDVREPEVPESRREESEVESSRPSRGRSWATNTGPNHTSVRPTSVGSSGPASRPPLAPLGGSPSGGPGAMGSTRGALAVETDSRSRDAASATPAAASTASTPDDAGSAPAEITSLQPTSYNEARVIGERYRDGIPVIMNLTDMDEVAAKRLVDFAAGLAFALRGSIEKVTNRVFLLSPPNVEVSAAERRKLAENSYSAAT